MNILIQLHILNNLYLILFLQREVLLSSVAKMPKVESTRNTKKKKQPEKVEKPVIKPPDHRLGKPAIKIPEVKEYKILSIYKPPLKDETLKNFDKLKRQPNCNDRDDLPYLKPGQKIKIISWNVNGLRHLFDVGGIRREVLGSVRHLFQCDSVNLFQNFIDDGKLLI